MDKHNLTEEEKKQLRKEIMELITKPYQGIRGPRKTPSSKSEFRRREEREFNKRLKKAAKARSQSPKSTSLGEE